MSIGEKPEFDAMAKFRSPEPFNFNKPAEWPEWKQRFARYRTATKLNGEDEDVQICALIYAMGNEAEHIFKTFEFPDEQAKTYANTIAKFDAYFVPKQNIIHERARFHLRSQQSGESVEAFVRCLHEIAEHCQFNDKSEQIRDRLVIGIRDKDVSEKLQLRADLTLEKAIEIARNSELVKSQIKDLESKSLDAVKAKPVIKPKPGFNFNRTNQGQRGGAQRRPNATGQRSEPKYTCANCNRVHPQGQCPAKGKRCYKCKQYDHFGICCKVSATKPCKKIDEVYEDQTFYMGSIDESDTPSDPWYVELKICNRTLQFKIDTGADISTISLATYNSLPVKPKLRSVTNTFQSPGGKLACKGSFRTTTRFNHTFQRSTLHIHCSCD